MMNRPSKIIVHHTGGTESNPLADTSSHTFKVIDDYHRSLGWGKIGYHYFIEKDGKVTQGRQDTEVGAHTIGQNDTSLGICLAGNFDSTMPPKAQIASLRGLLLEKTQQYGVTQILPHRAFSSKTCYGRKLSDTWASELIKKEENNLIILQLKIKILMLKIQIMGLLGFK